MGPLEVGGVPEDYAKAFAAIDASPNQLLLVAEEDGVILGSAQVSYMQCLIERGTKRAILEAVFLHPDATGKGAGRALVQAAITAAREAGCGVVGLTSNKNRTRAIAFYEKLGFTRSHEGFKMVL